MEQIGALSRQIEDFMARVNEMTRSAEPSAEQIKALAQRLIQLARSSAWQICPYREAVAGEELLYELAVSPSNGPSLYLVSDGSSVVSPPHEHNTWAVIAGIRGQETNRHYALQSAERKVVVESSMVEVGPGEVLVLGATEIHSTEVNTSEATFHLHLYGRPLCALPSFASRSYCLASGA